MTRKLQLHQLIFPGTLVVCGIFLWMIRLDGFIPGDEGLLGQTAERVLLGEWPHLDFDDTYTGGQALLHAAVFRIFGVSSAHLRTLLWVASLLFLAAFFRLAAPEGWSQPAAALVTGLALSWSLPNYFAALPSWYNLFLATFGLLAMLRFIATGQRRFLALAGFCGGLSILFKVIGLLFLASASLMTLYFRQRQDAAEKTTAETEEAPMAQFGSGLFSAVVWAFALATAGGFYLLFRHAPTVTHVVYYVLPALGLVGILLWEEKRPKKRPGSERLRIFATDLSVLGSAAILPVLVFLLPYARFEGGLAAWWQGVFVLPALRVDVVAYPLPNLSALLVGLPLAAALVLALRNRWRWGWVVLGAGCLVVVLFGDQAEIHVAVWRGARLLIPLTVIDGIWRLAQNRRESSDLRVFAVVATLAFFSPIQFPYARGIYFCYVAPFLVLAIYTLFATRQILPGTSPRGMVLLATALGLFAVSWLHGSSIYAFGRRYEKRPELVAISEPRLGLRVPQAYARGYSDMIAFIREQVPPEQPILALPDLPQLYYFSGRRNPTRLLCDALTAESPSFEQYQRWLSEVGLVVINRRPEFSPPISPELEAAIFAAFPQKATLESFEIRFRAKP